MEPDKTLSSYTANHTPEISSSINSSFRNHRHQLKVRSLYSGPNLILVDGVSISLACALAVSSLTPESQTTSRPFRHIKKHLLNTRQRGKSCFDDSFILKSNRFQSTSPELQDSPQDDRHSASPTNASWISRRPRKKLSSPKQLERLFNNHFIKRISPKPRPRFPSITSRVDKNSTIDGSRLNSSLTMRKVVKPPSSGGFITKPCITIITAQVSRR
jgi:hypothetical protein